MGYTIEQLVERFPSLKGSEKSILEALDVLIECYKSGHKLLVAGNGGSSADAEHIVGELMKGFKNPRKIQKSFVDSAKKYDAKVAEELGEKLQGGLPAIALTNHQGLNTAFINDVDNGGVYIFAQQVSVYGQAGDVFLGISTSGNSKNVYAAAVAAKAKGLKVIALTGEKESKLSSLADVTIKAPSCETFVVQEYHLPIYHFLCLKLEEEFF